MPDEILNAANKEIVDLKRRLKEIEAILGVAQEEEMFTCSCGWFLKR